MKQDEARKKWCPFARVFTGTSSAFVSANRNMLERDENKANCIGSACMAWRYTYELDQQAGGYCGLVIK
jgi:hypothetical protein